VLTFAAPVALVVVLWFNLRACSDSASDRPPVSSACAYLRPEDVSAVFKIDNARLVEEAPRDSSGFMTYGCDVRTESPLTLRLDVTDQGSKPDTPILAMAVSKQAAYATAGTAAELTVVKQVDKKFYVLKLTGSQAGAPVTEGELAVMSSLVVSRF
jgi:hypothetical protein